MVFVKAVRPEGTDLESETDTQKDSDEKRPSKSMLTDAAAGAIAGCIARICTGPLDVIKIRFQVQLEPIVNLQKSASAIRATSKYTGFTQALTSIVREEGIQALWRGTVPGLLLTVPYTAVQFVVLSQVKAHAVRLGLNNHPQLAPAVSLFCGAAAGTAATVASYPFDLLRTTLAAQGEPKVYKNMLDAARGIAAQRGPLGLFTGLGVTLIEILPYSALQFGLYDTFNNFVSAARVQAALAVRQSRLPVPVPMSMPLPESAESNDGEGSSSGLLRHLCALLPLTGTAESRSLRRVTQNIAAKTNDNASQSAAALEDRAFAEAVFADVPRWQHFSCGLIAGLLAKLATHPLDVAKKRYQVAGLGRSLKYGARVEAGFAARSLGESLVLMYRQEGLLGLWKGSLPSIVKAAPSAAITLTVYEAALQWLRRSELAAAAPVTSGSGSGSAPRAQAAG